MFWDVCHLVLRHDYNPASRRIWHLWLCPICSHQASIVASNDYRNWRQYGVAFGIREGTYDVPNRTHASGHVFNVVSDTLISICIFFCGLFPILGWLIEFSFSTLTGLVLILSVLLQFSSYNIAPPQFLSLYSFSSLRITSLHLSFSLSTPSVLVV